MRRLLGLALLLGSVACASAPAARPATTESLADADRIRLDGCYDCLIDARDRYRDAAVGGNGLRAKVREFETELLIALREREFAIENTPTIERARVLMNKLPASIEPSRYLALVEAVPHRGSGWSRRDSSAFRAAHSWAPGELAQEVAWVRAGVLSSAVREYLARSLECSAAPVAQAGTATRPPDAAMSGAEEPALIRYRMATCRAVDAPALVEIRARVPRFVETSYWLGELAVASIANAGGLNPHSLVDQVARRFPSSPVVAALGARLKQLVGDCEGALSAFDGLLALSPEHEDGWLGRVMCLTDLLRHSDGISAATHMIDRGFDNADDALYWRAWNLHLSGDLPAARTDIDAARQRRLNASILTLAGVIEHDQNDLQRAERDLQDAQRMGSGKVCRAYWYLGSALLKRQAWPEAAQTFEASLTCYADDAAIRERLLDTLLANAALDPEFRRLQSARLREEARLQRHQQYASALNVANIHVARRELARAEPFLDVAARDPEFADQVSRLRAEIDRLTRRGLAQSSVAQ